MYRKIMDNHVIDPEEAKETERIVGLAAIKYGDLSNQPSKDYVFDMERFTSFEIVEGSLCNTVPIEENVLFCNSSCSIYVLLDRVKCF